jgi:hypothetical protein
MQELAEGKSLAQLVQEGWRPDEAEITRIAQQLLGVLEYLSSRRPPVVHRCERLAELNSQRPLALLVPHQGPWLHSYAACQQGGLRKHACAGGLTDYGRR